MSSQVALFTSLIVSAADWKEFANKHKLIQVAIGYLQDTIEYYEEFTTCIMKVWATVSTDGGGLC